MNGFQKQHSDPMTEFSVMVLSLDEAGVSQTLVNNRSSSLSKPITAFDLFVVYPLTHLKEGTTAETRFVASPVYVAS